MGWAMWVPLPSCIPRPTSHSRLGSPRARSSARRASRSSASRMSVTAATLAERGRLTDGDVDRAGQLREQVIAVPEAVEAEGVAEPDDAIDPRSGQRARERGQLRGGESVRGERLVLAVDEREEVGQ